MGPCLDGEVSRNVLLLLGLRSLLSRTPAGESSWSSRLAGVTPVRSAGLGALLAAANPKVIALVAAGGLAIGQSSSSFSDEVAQALLFTAVASLGVAFPLAVHLAAGDRAERWLRAAEAWLDRRGDQVMGAVLLVIGALLLVDVLL